MIDLRHTPDGKAKVLKAFVRNGIFVPQGFISDGASAPRVFWWIIPPYKQTAEASVVHDYLCKNAKNKMERRKADKLFYRILKKDLVPKVGSGFIFQYKRSSGHLRALAGYLGVRLGAFLGIGVRYDHWRLGKCVS